MGGHGIGFPTRGRRMYNWMKYENSYFSKIYIEKWMGMGEYDVELHFTKNKTTYTLFIV